MYIYIYVYRGRYAAYILHLGGQGCGPCCSGVAGIAARNLRRPCWTLDWQGGLQGANLKSGEVVVVVVVVVVGASGGFGGSRSGKSRSRGRSTGSGSNLAYPAQCPQHLKVFVKAVNLRFGFHIPFPTTCLST